MADNDNDDAPKVPVTVDAEGGALGEPRSPVQVEVQRPRAPKWLGPVLIGALGSLLGGAVVYLWTDIKKEAAKLLNEENEEWQEGWTRRLNTLNSDMSSKELELRGMVDRYSGLLEQQVARNTDFIARAQSDADDLRVHYDGVVDRRLAEWNAKNRERYEFYEKRSEKEYRDIQEQRRLSEEAARDATRDADLVRTKLVELRVTDRDADKLRGLIEDFNGSIDDVVDRLRGEDGFVERVVASAGLSALPLGTIVAWPGLEPPNDYWAVCDGSVVDDPDGKLAELLLSAHYPEAGPVDGGQVRLPNFQGYFLRAYDRDRKADTAARRLGEPQEDALGKHGHDTVVEQGGLHQHAGTVASAGSHSHNATISENGSHTHNFPHRARENGGEGNRVTTSTNEWNQGPSPETNPSGSHSHTTTISRSGSHTHAFEIEAAGRHSHKVKVVAEGGAETRPKNVSVSWIIKVR